MGRQGKKEGRKAGTTSEAREGNDKSVGGIGGGGASLPGTDCHTCPYAQVPETT